MEEIAISKIAPPPAPKRPADWIGSFKATGQILGDIVSPASDEDDWEVLRR